MVKEKIEGNQDKEYETLLDRAYSKIKKVEVTERFEVPEAESYVEGTKTIVSNLLQIASFLRRDIGSFYKVLVKRTCYSDNH